MSLFKLFPMVSVTRIFDLIDLLRSGERAGKAVFGVKRGNQWLDVSASAYIRSADHISLTLIKSGFSAGDKVLTIIGNMPEWNYFDMGIQQAGCVHIPVYHSLSEENYRFIINDSGAKLVIVGCQEAWERIKPVIAAAIHKPQVYAVFPVEGLQEWPEDFSFHDDGPEAVELSSRKKEIAPQDLATIIYTSGTTGYPKGVMLSHHNLVSNFLTVSHILADKQVEKALSFLPLCHVYERMLNYMYQYLGITVYYAENFDRIRDNLREIRPTMFCAVPRVLEKSYAAILRKGKNLPMLRKIVFFQAMKIGFAYEIEKSGRIHYRLLLKIADLLVFSKWRKAFGNQVKYIVSGGAPLNPKLARIFWAAGMQVIEGYGMTETSPVIATGTFEPDGVMFGTVGKVLPGVEVRIDAEGEILCRGPNVMLGYYNLPEMTAEVIDPDGWLHTGDIGELVNGKYLRITDRKKEIFKTSGGKYVAPQMVETRLKESPFIENVLVVGENRNYTAALIVPCFEYLRSWCMSKGMEYTTNEHMVELDLVKERFLKEVRKINGGLDHPSQVRKFILTGKEWSVQSGELSFTMKVRRTHLQKVYAAEINAMYPGAPDMTLQKKKHRKPGRRQRRK